MAAANAHTIVVLNTGSAVTMPWLSSVAGVLESWYPGQSDGTAIAAVLFGSVDPSGHLPVTFPTSLSQVPAQTAAEFRANGQVQYNEGIDVGYRYYQVHGETPLFPFGFGLSYTTFSFSNLTLSGNPSTSVTASATITNTGSVAGSDVAQAYVGDPSSTGEPPWQLKGFSRVTLNAGQSAPVTFTLPATDFTYYAGSGWQAPMGTYSVAVGDSSANLPLTGTMSLTSAVGPDFLSVTNPGNQTTGQGSGVSLQMSGSDTVPSGQSTYGSAVNWTATALPGGLSISSTTGLISGTALHQGSDTVTVSANDGLGQTQSVSFTWMVGASGTTTTSTTSTTTLPGVNCSNTTTSGTPLSRTAWVASTNTAASGADVPANAIDGNLTTRFSSDAVQAAGQTLEMNMGSPQTFNELEMEVPNSAGDYARAYNVEVSNNGTSWAVVASCTGTGTPEIVSFPSQTAQYVEVVLTAGGTTSWWSVDELYLFTSGPGTTTTTTSTSTTAVTGVNCSATTAGTALSRSGWVASSNTAASGNDVPANALDGNLATRFSSDEFQASGLYFQANLGSAQTVGEVDMQVPNSAGDYARGYTVGVSTNGSTFTTVATCTGSSSSEVAVSFPAQSAQYVRVTLDTASTTNWWSIDEFYLYS